ncbi:MAG: hypothetical protein ACPKNR_13580 [Pleomorphochaeta sp.]|jgi:vacuolar-type H+-ATPase subunit H
MQSDIISEIIEVEDNATKIVEQARQKSTKIIAEAEMKVKEDLKKAVKERRLINNQKIEELKTKNALELESFEDDLKSSINIDYDCIDKISDDIASKICNSTVFDK